MKLLKILFTFLGKFTMTLIIFVLGFMVGMVAYYNIFKNSNSKNAPDYIDKILSYQSAIEQLDVDNIDSTRYLLTDIQNKEILGLYPKDQNVDDKRYNKISLITLNKVAKYRKKNNNLYYPNGKSLIPMDENIEILLTKSLEDSSIQNINK